MMQERLDELLASRKAGVERSVTGARIRSAAVLLMLDEALAIPDTTDAASLLERIRQRGNIPKAIEVLEAECQNLATSIRQLRADSDLATRELVGWQDRVMRSVEQGRDDLARQAIANVAQHQSVVDANARELALSVQLECSYRGIVAQLRQDGNG